MADYDAYILREELRRRVQKAVYEPSIERLRDKLYYDGYFLEMLKLRRLPLHYPVSDGTPVWWERKAHKKYPCSICREMISNGERYIGQKKLSPGMRGRYGYRGTYSTNYYHIVCLLEAKHNEAEYDIRNSSSRIGDLQNQITSFKDRKSQRKNQIEFCEIVKQKAKKDYEDSNSWRRLVNWIGCKYTSWSKNREIRTCEKEIIHIESTEIPMRENRIRELDERINRLRSWQAKLKQESKNYLSPPRGH